MVGPMTPPFRRAFDAAQNPLVARNALGIIGTGGSGGAPATAEYITGSADATLTNERVLTNTATVTWDFSTAGQAKATATVDLSAYAPLASPTFTGDPTAPTPATGDNDTSIATTAFVKAQGYVTGGPYQPLDGDLTAIAALAGTNTIYYRSATDTWSGVTIGTGLTFSAGTLSASGSSTATVTAPQGRLTLQTATPVMITTQSAKTTIYYTPYVGNLVPIYDGSAFTMTTCAEISVATTDTSKNPAAIGASKVNDWFVWSDAGTLRLTHGPDWTSDTARSAGTALTRVNGIWLNNASITNGPAASRGTYVGTTRSNASSQLDWILGGTAAGGTAAIFGVWNCYHRVSTTALIKDTGNWSYSTATWRSANGSNGNRASVAVGLAEEVFEGIYGCYVTGAGEQVIGVGYDTTSNYSSYPASAASGSAADTLVATHSVVPDVGYHFLQAVEYANGAGNFGNATAIRSQGFTVNWRC